jgi:hypothetical protein
VPVVKDGAGFASCAAIFSHEVGYSEPSVLLRDRGASH